MSAGLDLRGVDVTLSRREILHRIDLAVQPGELVVLLGAAGSGKSTLLRAIAGLAPLTAGTIHIGADDISRLPAERRNVAIMLQGFPLWPDMSVAGNIAFGLRQRHLSRGERRTEVADELAFVGLADFARHRPSQLSAAQRQRVALARTIAARARLMLLDEPFRMQDAQLHERLLRALRRRLAEAGATTLFATQSSDQALRIADRVAVIHNGMVHQVGTPEDLYDAPVNRQVAETLGAVNLIDGTVEYAGDQAMFRADNGILFPLFDEALRRPRHGTAMFRPHALQLIDTDDVPFGERIRFSGPVTEREFLGDRLRCAVDLAGWTVWIDIPRHPTSRSVPGIGERVALGLDPAAVRILER